MQEETDIEKKLRKAAVDQLELAFYQPRLEDNIADARALVSFLQLTSSAGDEPDPEALHGYTLILALIDIILAQASRRIRSNRPRGNAAAQLRPTDGESTATGVC